MLKTLVTIALLLLCAPLALADATVSVIHGIPGLPDDVDVFANGDMLFSFDFGDIEGPLLLPAGRYDLEVKLAGETVLATTGVVTDGGDFTVLAHYTYNSPGEAPGIALSIFQNDVSGIGYGDARLIVRHGANAPNVTVQVDQIKPFPWYGRVVELVRGSVRLPSLSNATGEGPGQVGPVDVRETRVNVSLQAGGSTVFSTGSVTLSRKVVHIAYAVGDFFGNSFTILLQTIPTVAPQAGDSIETLDAMLFPSTITRD